MQTFNMIFLLLVTKNMEVNQEEINNSRTPPSLFRLRMEEKSEDQLNKDSKDEPNYKLVSFLIDNVMKLLGHNNITSTTVIVSKINNFDPLLDIFRTSPKPHSNNSFERNYYVGTKFALKFLKNKTIHDNYNLTRRVKTDNHLLSIPKIIESSKEENPQVTVRDPDGYFVMKASTLDENNNFRRTCIACNNIVNEECSDPKFKFVPSVVCERQDDLCYAQHTPYGLIDRGCFNVNHNLTLFVCACNLCNYISIAEMPYIFSNKRDWIENVIELSRAKRFRESIFKDMSCLRCEVNVTAKTEDMVADVNCLDGNIASLPSQVCSPDEICAVKAIRSEGYVWRGCVSEPLYNYWWTLCDSDLCNYDGIVSVYDNTDI